MRYFLKQAVLSFLLLILAPAAVVSDEHEDSEIGLLTVSPEAVGLTQAPLDAMTRLLQEDAYPNVHALLIAVGGSLVYEEYFHGTDRRWSDSAKRETVELTFDRDTLHDTRSAGKSITSAVVGIAVGEGAIKSVDQPVFDYFPEHIEAVSRESRAITLEDVLTMSAGLQWNEMEVPYTDPTNDEIRMEESGDQAGYVLRRPLASPPGTRWYYNSGLPTVLGFVVARATDQSFGEFARARLFEPLGMRGIEWGGCCDQGHVPELSWSSDKAWAQNAVPGGSLWIRPRDLLKFGLMYANDGVWQGKQIVPTEWVRRSLEPLVPTAASTLDHGNGVRSERRYGYQWWYNRFDLPYGEVIVHEASGNGGQKLWLIPQLDLVGVHMTGNYNQRGAGLQAESLLLERIVPWAMGIDADYRHGGGRSFQTLAPGEWPEITVNTEHYTGVYEEAGQRVEIQVVAGRLVMLRDKGRTYDLLAEERNVFAAGEIIDGVPRRIFSPGVRIVFVYSPEGTVTQYEIRRPGASEALLVAERVGNLPE